MIAFAPYASEHDLMAAVISRETIDQNHSFCLAKIRDLYERILVNRCGRGPYLVIMSRGGISIIC